MGSSQVGLPADELHRALATSQRAKATHVLARPRCRILLRIGALDGVADSIASDSHGLDPHMPFTHLNGTERILEKRPIPAGGLQRPGTNVDATVNHYRPHTDEAVIGSGAGANTQDLALVDCGHERPRQAAGCSSSSNGLSSHHDLLRSWCSCLRRRYAADRCSRYRRLAGGTIPFSRRYTTSWP